MLLRRDDIKLYAIAWISRLRQPIITPQPPVTNQLILNKSRQIANMKKVKRRLEYKQAGFAAVCRTVCTTTTVDLDFKTKIIRFVWNQDIVVEMVKSSYFYTNYRHFVVLGQ